MLEELLVKSRGHGTRVMKVTLRDAEELIPPGPALLPHDLKLLLAAEGSAMPPEIPCESLGPSLPDSNDIARLWDRVTLTDDEDRVLRAVNLASGEEVVRIAVIGDGIGQSEQSPHGRRVVVRLRDHKHPLPIKGLGDGAVRLLGIAVALANSQDGFLLIDEAENGIHHALQRDFWRMVLQTAQDNNVQVFATTHGWDCVRGFAQAAIELDAVEGVLVRLERKGDRIQAVEYPEEELIIAAQSGIEVR
ncbi:MAG: AAA family ATPase [bacterium]|nr:AAA family ATPase [bacterium]